MISTPLVGLDVRFLHIGLGRANPSGAVGGIGKVQLETYRHFLNHHPFQYLLLGSSRYSERCLRASFPNLAESSAIQLFQRNKFVQAIGDKLASVLFGDEDQINREKLLKTVKIDIVHAHEQVWHIFPNQTAPYKAVVTMHSHLFSESSPNWQKDEQSLSDDEKIFLERLRACDGIFGVSRSVCDYLVQNFHIPKEKVFVTYSGVNSEIFKPLHEESKGIDSIHRRFGIKKPYFCYVGSWKRVKNIPTLIRIYEEYRKNSPREVQLALVGNIPKFTRRETIEIRKLISNSPYRSDIIEISHLPDSEIAKLLNDAELFLYTSFHEGFGLCVAEAMACGTPIVASRGATIYAESGLATELLSPIDVNGFVERIFKIQENESYRQDLIRRQLDAIKSFTWDVTALHTINAYSKVLNA